MRLILPHWFGGGGGGIDPYYVCTNRGRKIKVKWHTLIMVDTFRRGNTFLSLLLLVL